MAMWRHDYGLKKFPEWWLDVEGCSCFIILVEFLSPFYLSLFLVKVIVIEFGAGCCSRGNEWKEMNGQWSVLIFHAVTL